MKANETEQHGKIDLVRRCLLKQEQKKRATGYEIIKSQRVLDNEATERQREKKKEGKKKR